MNQPELSQELRDLIRIQEMQAYLESERHKIPQFEVRLLEKWWIPFAWTHTRQHGCIIAGSMYRILKIPCQVWSLEGLICQETGRWISRQPTLYDQYPDYWQIYFKEVEKPEAVPAPEESANEWEKLRKKLPPYELLRWYERPLDVDKRCLPSQFLSGGFFHHITMARLTASTFLVDRDLKMQIWQIHPSDERKCLVVYE
ncbi:hypothetical protein NIES2119_08025 [[Phormidium ambiguum] IAM M-71]|uniref:Uncharacterized protein n=1 Tax=[Phormidium ambiguum] IAM M-71 TaxID=454136 RepID=A0A1U7INZ9_9CYAN|nr:hypothetical protein [Phormidium ambiguum]OKH39067.1 hypothetical protein NIES2119_08025 [Phormidium ambiguum IAM M-71]